MVQCPRQIYLWKILHPKTFFHFQGRKEVHQSSNVPLEKFASQIFFSFLEEGGRGYIPQVKCTFGKIYIPKTLFVSGGGKAYIAQIKSTFGKIYIPFFFHSWGREGVHHPSQMYLWKNLHPNFFFISEGGREGYAAQVKCTFGKIYATKKFSFLGEGGGTSPKSNLLSEKFTSQNYFSFLGEEGRQGVHHQSQMYLWKNLHPKNFFHFQGRGEGGRKYITQVKCTFMSQIYVPKNFFIPGGGRERVHCQSEKIGKI